MFPRIWFRDLRFRNWGLEINHLNAHNFVWQGLFFFHYYITTLMTDWAQIFTGLLFYAYVEIHTPTVKASLWQLPIVSTAFNSISNLRWFKNVVAAKTNKPKQTNRSSLKRFSARIVSIFYLCTKLKSYLQKYTHWEAKTVWIVSTFTYRLLNAWEHDICLLRD